MKTLLQNTLSPKLHSDNPIAPGNVADEQLMPFGKAAKAIFVKANGLPAYYKSAGALRYTA